MWTSTNFKTYEKLFDFSSSEQGKPTYTALKIDDKDFINMVEGLDGEIEDDQVFQTIICDHCGTYHCEPGNWVAIRQLNNFIFFIPAFENLLDEPNKGEHEPPFSLRKNGAYWLKSADFENFKKLVPELDKQKTIRTLTKFELISLYQWDTPHKMFGDFPEFTQIKKNHILAVSGLDNETAIDIIEKKLNELENSLEFEIKPVEDNNSIISIFLDDSSTTEWKALCKTDENFILLLGGTFKILTK